MTTYIYNFLIVSLIKYTKGDNTVPLFCLLLIVYYYCKVRRGLCF